LKFLKTNGASDQIGLALLGVMGAFGAWSSVNPSFFTIREFSTQQSAANVRFGMKIGVVLNALLGAGLALAYGKRGVLPGVVTAATGVGLYAMYEWTLARTHINNPDQKNMDSYRTLAGGVQ